MPAPPRTPIGRALADRGLLRPPALQTDETRGASRLELFFDLAFVLAIAELATGLREEVTPHTALVTAGLFTVVWWSWMSSTLYANRFDHDDVLFRTNKLAGMLAVVGMAASVSDATGKHATAFVLSYVAIRVLLLGQYARAYRHVEAARDGIRIYLYGTGAGAVLWLASLTVDGPTRPGPVRALGARSARRRGGAAAGHRLAHARAAPPRAPAGPLLAVRHPGARGVRRRRRARGARRLLGPGVGARRRCLLRRRRGAVVELLRPGRRGAKHLLLEAGGASSTVSHDVYVYGQLPLTLALAAVGVGIEGLVLEGTAEVGAGLRVLLSGGVALYLLTVGVTNVAMARGSRNGWWWAALASVVAIGDTLLDVPALGVAAVLAVLLVVVVVTGLEQKSRGNVELETL